MTEEQKEQLKRIRFAKRKIKEAILTKYFETGDKECLFLLKHL
jgi:hypothetical protein